MELTSILVVYGSHEGQTAKVAERVGTILTDRGSEVAVVNASIWPTVAIEEFDAVAVGSPVINRKHLPEVVEFVEANRETLSTRPTAFFQLSFASAIPSSWAQEGAGEYVDALVERTGWQPDRIGLFAGAVKYTQYDALTRLFFKLFSAITTGDTDTSQDYEYTDWDEVETFATEFATFVDKELATRVVDTGRRAETGVEGVPESTGRKLARRAARIGFLAGVLGVVYWLVVRKRSLHSFPSRRASERAGKLPRVGEFAGTRWPSQKGDQ